MSLSALYLVSNVVEESYQESTLSCLQNLVRLLLPVMTCLQNLSQILPPFSFQALPNPGSTQVCVYIVSKGCEIGLNMI